MILKHWNDWNGYHEIQLFSFQDSKRAIYQINKEVVFDKSYKPDTTIDIVRNVLDEYYNPRKQKIKE